MHLIQNIVNEWQRCKFPDATPEQQLDKVAEELSELREALMDNHPTQAIHCEIADVAIALMGLAYFVGCNLEEAIKTKMGINCMRDWTRDEDGSYHHV